MLISNKNLDREHISGLIIIIGIITIFASVIGIRLIGVNLTNIETVDRNTYTVFTEKGSYTILSSDILRIERTYTKTAITGVSMELDKIYTTKGFIYMSAQDSFGQAGKQMIDSVDFYGNQVWFPQNTTSADNLKLIKTYNYALGTPEFMIPILSLLLIVKNIAFLAVAIALLILIFPFHMRMAKSEKTEQTQEITIRNNEEKQYGIAIK